MKQSLSWTAACLIVLATGCEKKDQDAALAQGQVAFSKAKQMAGGFWKSACAEADKLSADSGKSALESAKTQLESARDRLSHIQAPSELDGLKMDSVKEEIQRLQAALTVQNIKEETDRRVKDAMTWKENAEKTVDEVKAKLAQADAEYQDLQKKLHDAQATYDDASTKVKETTQKIQSL